jgi:DNA-binding MurR/RpiR family transcriptional regulator
LLISLQQLLQSLVYLSRKIANAVDRYKKTAMSTRLALRIQERFDKLPPSEQKLATLVLEQQSDILTFSATELASMAKVSKATAARLFRNLGYRDFNEVRVQAREERNRTAPFQRLSARSDGPLPRRSIASHLQAEMGALTATFEQLRPDTLARAAELISKAPRVWLLGLGAAGALARFALGLFRQIRTETQILGTHDGMWAEELALMGPRDVMLITLFEERPKIIRSILEYVATTHANVVAVVDARSTEWIRRFSKVVLPCYGTGLEPDRSSASMISMLRLLAMATAEKIGPKAMQRTELISEIHEELEDLME